MVNRLDARKIVFDSFIRGGFQGQATVNRFSVYRDFLRIDIIKGTVKYNEENNGMLTCTLVCKEKDADNIWVEMDRFEFASPLKIIDYNVSKFIKSICDSYYIKNTKLSKVDKELEKIAKEYLHIETWETRNSDSLDFYDVSIWGIRSALEKAFELGTKYKG